ncbi:PREDICTED: C-type lectin BPL-like [Thamnophis sirtalis]|uniref:C-type lectin BPL-like n=1 Tax=Thamnophis sirtalis TaxID=35019 RepID=A0A6I9YNT3_9SAUR|nr:PREDICTED: C-type lectin BPL-like [Thamnophis sirtalis]
MAVSHAGFCPREWLRYQRNCYGLFHEKLSWHEAEIRCQSYGRGTHLTSILTWPETLIVCKHISDYMKEKGVDVWIGLHDVRHNGNWRWTDESVFNYKNWMHGEPNNLWNSEYCVALRAAADNFYYCKTSLLQMGKCYLLVHWSSPSSIVTHNSRTMTNVSEIMAKIWT